MSGAERPRRPSWRSSNARLYLAGHAPTQEHSEEPRLVECSQGEVVGIEDRDVGRPLGIVDAIVNDDGSRKSTHPTVHLGLIAAEYGVSEAVGSTVVEATLSDDLGEVDAAVAVANDDAVAFDATVEETLRNPVRIALQLRGVFQDSKAHHQDPVEVDGLDLLIVAEVVEQ